MKIITIISSVLSVLTLAAAPVKVVSLSPAVTEVILAIGGKSQLAGRSSACDMAAVRDIPVVGDLGRPFVEPVLQSGAKVVLSDTIAPGKEWGMLQKCQVRTLHLPGRRIQDLPGNIRQAGKTLHRETAAKAVAEQVESELSGLRRNVPAHPVSALVVISLPPVVSCGAESFLDEALQLAGAQNIARKIPGNYFVLSNEFICAAAPEVIISFISPELTEKYFSRQEFRHLPAVKNRRFVYPDTDSMCRLTPRLPGAIKELKRLLAGDLLQK